MTCDINIKGHQKQNEEITFQFGSMKFCKLYASCCTSRPNSNFFSGCESMHSWMEKSFCFSTKRLRFAPCRFSFTSRYENRVQIKLTQERYVSEIPFQNPLEAGNQLNAGVLNQSASSNHALLITKSALVIKKKCPLSQPISSQ